MEHFKPGDIVRVKMYDIHNMPKYYNSDMVPYFGKIGTVQGADWIGVVVAFEDGCDWCYAHGDLKHVDDEHDV